MMMWCRCTISTFILLVTLTFVTSVSHGGKIRITEKGFAYVNAIAEASLKNALQALSIPDQSGIEGPFTWNITNIQSDSIFGPSSQISLNPEIGGVTFTVSKFGIKLRAQWRTQYKILMLSRGNVDIDVSGATLSVPIELGEQGGHLTASVKECSCNIRHFRATFRGGIGAFVLNLLVETVSDEIKRLLQIWVCETVTSMGGHYIKTALYNVRDHVDAVKFFNLNLSLAAAPVVTDTYLEVLNKAEMKWKGDNEESPFSPGILPAWNEFDSMLYLFLSDYTATTFAHAAHKHGIFQYKVPINDLKFLKSEFQDITSQISALYPNAKLELRFSSTASPIVNMNNQNISLQSWGDVEMVAVTNDGASSSVFIFNMSLSVAIKPSILNEKLIGAIVDRHFDVDIVNSEIGPVDPEYLRFLVGESLDVTLLPKVNDIGAKGIDLILAGNIRFYNTKVTLLPGALLVSTDIKSQ